MTQRLNITDAAGTGASWAPASLSTTVKLQAKASTSAVNIEVQGSNDNTNWVSLGTFSPYDQPIVEFTPLKNVRLKYSGNTPTNNVSAWDTE